MAERTCPVCRVRSSPTQMVRFVRSGDTAVPDVHRRQSGRGAWVHPRCLHNLARQREMLGKALRGRAVVSPLVVEQVSTALKQAIDDQFPQATRLGLTSSTLEEGVVRSRRTNSLREKLALLAEIG